MGETHYDWIVVGSGFGGSVSALRLVEKGYRVLVLEKGRRFGTEDFPRTNWDLKRWMWMPGLGMRGIFQMSFLPHVTVLHGVGVGGGSLTYACTLPTPSDSFFHASSWSHLGDWKRELEPHYATARRMLGAAPNPFRTPGDDVLGEIAEDMGLGDELHPTQVGIHFGEPGRKVPDPYFGGEGPDRVGCTGCGACMTGCRVGAKNTLDRNYLYLAENRGARVLSDTEVEAIRPVGERGADGYRVETVSSGEGGKTRSVFTADRMVLAGGVMGTVPLLLRMREDREGLPHLSEQLGHHVRTNNEALIGVVTPRRDLDLSRGVAITSILETDEHSHIEPVRYGAGSGFFRTMTLPHVPAPSVLGRLAGAARSLARHPIQWGKALTVSDYARQSQVLLYMRTLEGTLTMRLGRSAQTGFRKGLITEQPPGTETPKAYMKEATELAERFARKVDGVAVSLLTETLMGVPSTAHILGGCTMGRTGGEGVIDPQHRVHGYEGLYVLDGSAVSANPGVNPSLTITAMSERAMAHIPAKSA